MNCSSTINKEITTDTIIELNSNATVGLVQSECIGEPKIDRLYETCDKCTYMVEQLVDVKFPLTLSTKANVNRCGIICDSTCQRKKYCRRNCLNIRKCCLIIIACCFGIRVR